MESREAKNETSVMLAYLGYFAVFSILTFFICLGAEKVLDWIGFIPYAVKFTITVALVGYITLAGYVGACVTKDYAKAMYKGELYKLRQFLLGAIFGLIYLIAPIARKI